MTRITKRSVDALQAGDKDSYLWDDELTGFGLKVTPAGKKVFLAQYRIGGRAGRTRRVTIGPMGTLTPDEARIRAKNLLGTARSGKDPASDRDRQRADSKFGDVVDRFLDEHVKPKLKPMTETEYRRAMKLHLPKPLRARLMGDVERSDIAKLHSDLKTLPITANKVLAILSKVFAWAEKRGLRVAGENPCRHIERYPETKRERFLSPAELQALGNALETSDIEPYARAAIRLLLFTGARLNEILSMQWAWIDIARGTVRLPDSKTGAKTLYLNAPALEVLASLDRQQDNPFVICGGKAKAHLVNLQKPWRAVRAAAGLDDVRLHDLRHTFASVGAGGNLSLRTIGGLLGHSQPATTDRYAHLASDPMRAASDEIAGRISAAMIGGTAKVIPLKKGRNA